MLVLSRKVGEEIMIGDNIRVMIVAIRGNQVRLGFTAPANTLIRRAELSNPADQSYERSQRPPDERRRRRPGRDTS
jgi:carbon storage regulator